MYVAFLLFSAALASSSASDLCDVARHRPQIFANCEKCAVTVDSYRCSDVATCALIEYELDADVSDWDYVTCASKTGRLDLVDYYVDETRTPFASYGWGRFGNPFHYILRDPKNRERRSLSRWEYTFSKLVQKGIDVNAIDGNGNAPLVYASLIDFDYATMALVKFGANFDAYVAQKIVDSEHVRRIERLDELDRARRRETAKSCARNFT
jgi:hypothetical protein